MRVCARASVCVDVCSTALVKCIACSVKRKKGVSSHIQGMTESEARMKC